MHLHWKETNVVDKIEFSAESGCITDAEIKSALAECIEKAASMLSMNIVDESLYFLFEWDAAQSVLSIVVTDDQKKHDSVYSVRCQFSALSTIESDQCDGDSLIEKLQYWIKNYLTTCSAFMNFSLVAAFTSESRSDSMML